MKNTFMHDFKIRKAKLKSVAFGDKNHNISDISNS